MDAILEKSSAAIEKLIPAKSSVRYKKEYETFCEWRKNFDVENTVNENVMLAYLLDAVSVKLVLLKKIVKYVLCKTTLYFSNF